MTGGRCPSVAALTVSAPSGHPSKDLPAFPPLAQPFGRLQAGFLWIALANSGAFLSVNHIPPLPIPHGLEYPLGSRMHFGVVHPRLEARGRPFPRSPRSCSRVNLRVLRPLTRGPQRQPSPLRTRHGRPGVQGIFPTSRGQAPHGWPMVYHSMATGFPIPRGCCLALSASLPISYPVPLRHIGHRSLVSFIEAFESFLLRDVFMGKGVDILRLQMRPGLLHFHSLAACVRCVVELQGPLL